jgi:hypothetical protein
MCYSLACAQDPRKRTESTKLLIATLSSNIAAQLISTFSYALTGRLDRIDRSSDKKHFQ